MIFVSFFSGVVFDVIKIVVFLLFCMKLLVEGFVC